MIPGTNSSRKFEKQDLILRRTGRTGLVLLQARAPTVRTGQSSLMDVLDFIREVGCGNYRQGEKKCFKLISRNQSKDQCLQVCGYLLSK